VSYCSYCKPFNLHGPCARSNVMGTRVGSIFLAQLHMTKLLATPLIKDTLSLALEGKSIEEEKRKTFQTYLTQEEIPLEVLKDLSDTTQVYLHELLKGSKIALEPKLVKSLAVSGFVVASIYMKDPAKEAHKDKLRKAAEERAYYTMVRDIAVENPLAIQKDKLEMRSALKDAAIPLNIILTSVGAFVFGYYFVNWTTQSFYKVGCGEIDC